MVEGNRKEIVDFLNEKADTITNFVQAQEELSNVENVRFSVEGDNYAFCYIQFNEFAQSYSTGNLKWVMRNMGIDIVARPERTGSHTLQFPIVAFYAQPVVVRRNYDVLLAESVLQLIEERFKVVQEVAYEIDEEFAVNTVDWCAEVAKDQCYSDMIHGCEFDADLTQHGFNSFTLI